MMRIIHAVFKKNRIIATRAYPLSFIASRITGGFFAIIFQLMLFNLIFVRKTSDEFVSINGTGDYLFFAVMGQALSVLSFATLMNVGRCIISEIREGTIENMIITPCSKVGYFLGAYTEQLGRSAIEFSAMILIGIVAGMKIDIRTIPLFLLLFIISSLSFFSVSILISTIMVFTRDTYIVQNTVFIVMEFLCGVFFPVDYLPKVCQYISSVIPLTHVLSLYRRCMINGFIAGEMKALLVIAILSAVYFFLGIIGYSLLEKKIIEEVFA